MGRRPARSRRGPDGSRGRRGTVMTVSATPGPVPGRTLFFFEKPSAMRQLQRFFRSPGTVCVAAEGHLLAAEEPGRIRPDWKVWQFEALPIVLDTLPVKGPGMSESRRLVDSLTSVVRTRMKLVDHVFQTPEQNIIGKIKNTSNCYSTTSKCFDLLTNLF